MIVSHKGSYGICRGEPGVAATEVISAQDGRRPPWEPGRPGRAGILDGGRRAEELPGAETDTVTSPNASGATHPRRVVERHHHHHPGTASMAAWASDRASAACVRAPKR